MAGNFDMTGSVFIATRPELIGFLRDLQVLASEGPANFLFVGCNFMILDQPITREQLATAIATTPKTKIV